MGSQFGSSPFNSASIGNALAGGGNFPSPFLDLASLAMPDTNQNALRWSEYIYDQNETYRQAQERKFAYFITDIEIRSADSRKQLGDDEREKWINFLHRVLNVREVLSRAGRDREVYGNCFISVMVPFKRFLCCPKCGTHFALKEVYENPKFKFKWELPRFMARCVNCSYSGKFDVNDMPEDLENKLYIKFWPPHEIEILHDLYTDNTRYLWRIPEDYKRQIRQGHLFHLERVSMQVLQSIQSNSLFMFHEDVIYHMRVPVVSGRRHRGWGFSPILTNFRQIWYVQVLRRYNEAIGLDYIIPFRLITPEGRSGGSSDAMVHDPLRSMNMGSFNSDISAMIRRRRRDPAGWNFLPFPVQYHMLGGDAKQLAPAELLDQANDTMLNGAGTFGQLYRGDLELQVAPVALRLYEAVNNSLVHDFNKLVQWIVDQVGPILSWEEVWASLQRVTYADDFNKQMAQLQLMMGQAISQTTGLKALGLDWTQEQRRIAEETRRTAEMQAEVQEEMDQSAFAEQIAKGTGAAPGGPGAMGQPGAAPAGGGQVDPNTGQPAPGPVTGMMQSGGMPQSMDDMMAQAESLAGQLLGMPEAQKDSELRMLKQKNQVMHSLVRAKMDEMRGRAQTGGGAMLLQQQQQGAA